MENPNRKAGLALPMRLAIRASIALIILGVTVAPAFAQQGPPPGGRRMLDADQRLTQLTDALDLTDEQVEDMKPIVEEQTRKQKELFESAGADRAAMREAMMQLMEETDAAYAEVLTEDQMTKYREMRQQRMRRGPPPGGGR